jgi:hypothetical protein
VSGQLTPAEADKPTNSRFFGKPLEVKQMIAELQDMIGQGALRMSPRPSSRPRTCRRDLSLRIAQGWF